MRLEEEDLKWRQRAKQSWLQKGDRNTKYFHSCASQRKKSNHISSISDENGLLYNSPQGINQIFQNFFTNLFTTFNPTGKLECLESMQPLVYEEMNRKLLTEFTITKVEEAVFSMNPMSSPGPNGFSARFFQQN